MKVLSVLFCLLFVGCIGGENTPEAILTKLIDGFAAHVTDKDFYLELTTGELQKEMASADEENLKDYFLRGIPVKVNTKILKKNCPSSEHCSLTYIIHYNHQEEGKITSTVEVRKIAQLFNINGEWKVKSIRTRKTFIENPKDL